MKKYSTKELRDFVGRAYNLDRIEIALEYLSKLSYINKINNILYTELCMELFRRRDQILQNYCYASAYEDDYGAGCPWNAPGMSVKDFI